MIEVKFELPTFTEAEALELAREHYGLTGVVRPLPGERDQNFYLRTPAGEEYVLKIANPAEPRESLELQNQTLAHLAGRVPNLSLPRVIPARDGRTIIPLADVGSANLLRLFTFIPGRLWADCCPHTPALLRSLGEVVGTLDRALQGFAPAAARRELKWDLARAGWIRDYVRYIEDPGRRACVEGWLRHFDASLAPRLESLRTSVIYNDANDANILVGLGDPRTRRVIGLIDFGDLVYSQTVGELAIACAYAGLGQPDPLAAAAQVIAGYHSAFPLTEPELEVLFPLVCVRLCVSVTNSAFQRLAEPGNRYLLVSEAPAWELLEKLNPVPPPVAAAMFRAACGLPASPTAPAVAEWLKANRGTFGAVVQPDLSRAVIFDLSVGSQELGTNADFEDPAILADRLNNLLLMRNSTVGIGRYDEARPFYATAAYAADSSAGTEWSTIHLGLDFFLPAGSPVYAPIDGTVYLVDMESPAPALVLRHTPENCPTFFTLYRHLQSLSLSGWQPGMTVSRETCIGAVQDTGTLLPVHLHFQVIADLLGLGTDFPGLARPSQRAAWLGLSLDPDLILGLPSEPMRPAELPAGEILALRRRRLGRNLSLAFEQPVHLVRGYMQHLYDADGRRYLDAVNNVAHVGHSHPRVVQAAQGQMAVLNTNSRYLHANIVRYAERLCATLPEPLRVVYFVCSGSEANELALRLARCYTGSNETIVLERAYHGNTNALVEASPYKYEGPGGTGPRPFIHKVPVPDTYRGPHKAADPRAGERYARHVAEAAAAIQESGGRLSAFLAESLMGSAGQIPLAPNYLEEAYRAVREAGGVCIADEVQVGLGRVGAQFWGFQLHGVIPDIVTVGKPIGNGHPLGAVVTTPAIAAAFDNGMEYFNTFGGNPVSCAAGLAVLQVIEDEGLQAHALEVGGVLLEGLRQLQDRHRLIGDVRGAGLFLGVELVKDRETLERAGAEAGYVVNRLKDHGLLLSADVNCLKIKPPLPFDQADADFLVGTLDKILQEDFVRL